MWLRREIPVAVAICGLGLTVSYLAVNQYLPLAVAVAALPLLVWLLFRPHAMLIALGVSLPFAASIAGSGTSLSIAASDVLLTLIFCVVVAEALISRDTALVKALKPLILSFAPYLGWMLVLAAAHLALTSVVQSAQRLELFLFPVVVGVAVALRGAEFTLLRAYVVTTTVFAGLYPFFSTVAGGLGSQKNPAGGFIACGLLLLIGVKELRGRLLLAAPVLTLGLFWTQSRGAILSVVVGLVVLLLMNPGRERMRFLALMVPVAAVAAGAFALLPEEAQERNTSFDVGRGSSAAYSLEIREELRADAWRIVQSEPIFGTGIGDYLEGVNGIKPVIGDPHQVLVFQAAEGGYPLAGAFLILVLGSAAAIAWRGRRTALGPAAAAISIATAGHGLVDVYWVRGTPVLGWLVVGMAVGQMSLMKKRGSAEGAAEMPRDLAGVSR